HRAKVGVGIARVKPEQVEPDRLERSDCGCEVTLRRTPCRTDLSRLRASVAMRLVPQCRDCRDLLDPRARRRGMRLEPRDDARQVAQMIAIRLWQSREQFF